MKIILVDAVNTFIVKDKKGLYKQNTRMYKLLESFKNKKILVTNADDEQVLMFGINNSPYDFYTLKHKPDKTNDIYFKKLMKKYGLKAINFLYFDHNKEAVDVATSLGINSYYYDKNKKDLVGLKYFLERNL